MQTGGGPSLDFGRDASARKNGLQGKDGAESDAQDGAIPTSGTEPSTPGETGDEAAGGAPNRPGEGLSFLAPSGSL